MVTAEMEIALHAFHLDTHHFTERIDCTVALATYRPASWLVLRLVEIKFGHVTLHHLGEVVEVCSALLLRALRNKTHAETHCDDRSSTM